MSNVQMAQSTRYHHGLRLELPVLPSQPNTPRSKSRSRLRSLSNASKKIILKLQGKSTQETVPPVPALPPQATATELPPPPYTPTTMGGEHSRISSSSSSSSDSSNISRKPLRERCNFQLTVSTDESCLLGPEKNEFLADINNQLRKLASLRSQGPRASLLSPIHVSFPGHHTSASISSHPSTRNSLAHLHEILPYLSVAYCDSLAKIPPKRFTHVIKLIYLGDESHFFDLGGKKWSYGHAHHLLDHANNCQLLYLAVPRPAPKRGEVVGRGRTRTRHSSTSSTVSQNNNALLEEGKQTRLTADQLIYARDFLTLSLPYYAEAHPDVVHERGLDDGEARSADRVRVLICAPRGCPVEDDTDEDDDDEGRYILDEVTGATDIVSLATCYLAYATGMRVHDMLKRFNEDPTVPDLFKGAVCDASGSAGLNGVKFIEEISGSESSVYPCGN